MRLIDADAFLERIQNDASLCAELKLYGLKVLKRYLDLQPTAYNIDKVMEELYEERTEILLSNDYECEIINYCIDNFDKAIEIVKQGGVSDDMVEQNDNSFDGVLNNLPEPKPVPGYSC